MPVEIKIGDCVEVLKTMPDESVDCVVTSPPYWALRDYGVDGQLGLETTLGEHIDVMVAVFEEVKRVLKQDGTLWLNYGDCYATAPNGRSAADTKAAGNDDRTFRDKPFSTIGPVFDPNHAKARGKFQSGDRQSRVDNGGRVTAGGYMKNKDLCMVPNRLAIALQEAGWWVRSEIIWAKPNPMPESAKDRPKSAHEKIWLLSKAPKYYYDYDGVVQEASPNSHARLSQKVVAQIGSKRANGGKKSNGNMKAVARKSKGMQRFKPHGIHKARVKDNDNFNSALSMMCTERGLRNYEPAPVEVWNFSTAAFSEAHFATFPPELAERCIRAGCPVGGVVLDPFGGAGTTGLVADRMQRDAILIELNPEYAALAQKRIDADRGPLLDAMEKDDESKFPL